MKCDFDPISYINEPRWQASRLGLERVASLLDRMGRPQDRLRFVHVAGTNGKGSTCAYLESALRTAGYRTGLFTSPYIESFEERIRVCGCNISRDELVDVTLFVKRHADAVEHETGDHPTEFELMTAVAFEHFARSRCDIVVLEVGLGGRLDSTNVIESPELCVITRIGFDHTTLLGDTLRQIAREKCGIVKPGVTVVTWPQEPEAQAIVERTALESGSELRVPSWSKLTVHPLFPSGYGFSPKAAENTHEFDHTSLHSSRLCSGASCIPYSDTQALRSDKNVSRETFVRDESSPVVDSVARTSISDETLSRFGLGVGDGEKLLREDAQSLNEEQRFQNVSRETFVRKFVYDGISYETQLIAAYQPMNAVLAIEACAALRQRGWRIPQCAVQEGIACASWPGRFELVARAPLTIIDGGHNPQGAEALVESLSEILAVIESRGVTFVFGVLSDKDYGSMIDSVLPCAEAFFLYEPDNPRALVADGLADEILTRFNASKKVAFELAKAGADASDENTTAPFVRVCDDAADALAAARKYAGERGLVVAFGSLYSIAELRAAARQV